MFRWIAEKLFLNNVKSSTLSQTATCIKASSHPSGSSILSERPWESTLACIKTLKVQLTWYQHTCFFFNVKAFLCYFFKAFVRATRRKLFFIKETAVPDNTKKGKKFGIIQKYVFLLHFSDKCTHVLFTNDERTRSQCSIKLF